MVPDGLARLDVRRKVTGTRVMQTASILRIEVPINVFIRAKLFAVPIAVVVAIRRAIRGRQT
jgi:hypothetical protein